MPPKNTEKTKEYLKNYYKKNKKKLDERSKEWIKNNRERYNKSMRKSYYKHRKKRIKRKMEYNKEKYNTDINCNLKARLRSRIIIALKGNTKSKRTIELLGVPHLDFFKAWIESKFKEGMTWENRHLWHIDHIIPCSHFDLTNPEEQAKCFHYTNLQPLWASENLAKGSKIS